MDIHLTPAEARVLGSLMEKAATTPDYYPLSLKAVVSACNQKSNRDPVMNLSEAEALEALEGLSAKRLARERSSFGSRVSKYEHRMSGTLGLTHEFSREESAVLCVLMLRGAQTLGEIRSRSQRLFEFGDLRAVEQTLNGLMSRDDGPYVAQLARQPGRKEARYAHLLCGEVEAESAESSEAPVPAGARSGGAREDDRIAALERGLQELRDELETLKKKLELSGRSL